MERTRCQTYDRERGRMCRNKAFGDGPIPTCRRHVIESLRRYETQNPSLKWYLENRHLLEEWPP